MSRPSNRSVALDAYERLAESYAAHVDAKPHNAYYDRPAMLSLLPDVRGRWVLDAGCGPGAYAERLVERGAGVVAVDASEQMVRLARERLGDRARVMQKDFGEELDFADQSFDVVLSALALDYVRDWRPLFREFRRVLRSGGCFVFSIEHPGSAEIFRRQDNYFETELLRTDWRGFGETVNMPSHRRPLQEVINPLLDAGFVLERILEPRPTEEFKAADPKDYEELCREPGFLCLRALSP